MALAPLRDRAYAARNQKAIHARPDVHRCTMTVAEDAGRATETPFNLVFDVRP
ncbi:MAG: hypothetical protein ACREEO_09900 [Phenylobacterium sp.]